MDGNIEHQQDCTNLPFGVVVIGAASNRMADLRTLHLTCFTLSVAYGPGDVRRVGRRPKGPERS